MTRVVTERVEVPGPPGPVREVVREVEVPVEVEVIKEVIVEVPVEVEVIREVIVEVPVRATSEPGPTPLPQAQLSGRNAYTRIRDGNGDVFVMNADGSGLTQLTDGPDIELVTDWIPDGSEVVFHSGDGRESGVYRVGAHSGYIQSERSGPDNYGNADVSPNNQWIVFQSDRLSPGDLQLHIARRPLGRTWPRGDGEVPRWSPDGQRIALAVEVDGDWEIYVMDFDGSNRTRLTDSPGLDYSPDWSPDGRLITFS